MTFLEALVFLALPLIGLGPIWFLAPFVLLRLAERRPQRLCRTQKAILLSYDDGAWPGLTEKLADLLACYQVPATFFVMGHKVTNAGERVKIRPSKGCYGMSMRWAAIAITIPMSGRFHHGSPLRIWPPALRESASRG